VKFLTAGRANDVRIILYLFKAPTGPSPGAIAKVFVNSPQRDDDGEYFYGVLPPPFSTRELNRVRLLPMSKQSPYLRRSQS
jgi:hypothetical protein